MSTSPGHGALAEINQRLAEAAAAVQMAMPRYVPPAEGVARRLGEAVAYSLAGGKRLRPMLVRLGAETFGLDPELVTPTACAFELLHVATLIHDDLPALDDSQLRRGRPSCHVAFGEATAVLAGDSLIVAAFAALADQASQPATPPSVVVPVLAEFAAAVHDVIAGELADLEGERQPPDADLLEFIHLHKTASLITAAARAGAILAQAPDDHISTLTACARALGLLFQITDDLLDVVGDSELTGKPVGADQAASKQTYPAVFGLEETRRRAQDLAAEVRAGARGLPAYGDIWAGLAELVVSRRG
ncbi:MAG: polyprenyl synthetase family protein [Armatimonadetes bacterium]|nr:polyprenyl synthetase family protein [Armatimonadota bacterium]